MLLDSVARFGPLMQEPLGDTRPPWWLVPFAAGFGGLLFVGTVLVLIGWIIFALVEQFQHEQRGRRSSR
jgi:hypothetical protein